MVIYDAECVVHQDRCGVATVQAVVKYLPRRGPGVGIVIIHTPRTVWPVAKELSHLLHLLGSSQLAEAVAKCYPPVESLIGGAAVPMAHDAKDFQRFTMKLNFAVSEVLFT